MRRGLDLTLSDLASRAGATVDATRAVYDALGLVTDELAGFGPGDVDLISLTASDESGLVDDVGTQVLRVAGGSLRRVAEAVVAAYVQDVENHPDHQRHDLIELADMNAFASGLIVAVGDTLGTMFRHHMWTAVRRQRSGQRGITAPELIRMGVGFVDLVALPPNELVGLIEQFEQQAYAAAARSGGRVVKSIGDEVMIAGPDHATAVTIALDLIESFAGHESIRPRAGVSAGEVLFRLGDYYGPVVNLAARLVDVAGPGEVLTDREPSETDAVVLRPAGDRELKGFDDPVAVWSTT